ncbi:MAG: efflux RND transporter permease subunit [Spirochaetales bacterium]|nr:efflux RND transporter permease subunit [Spirochaetales bacterium]
MSVSTKVLDHPVLTLIVFSLLALLGLFTFGQVAIDLYPDIAFPEIMVITSYPDAGPESVEKSVTKILESSLVSVSNLEEISSTSSEGVSAITLEFGYGTDLDEATNDIRDKLDYVKGLLPDESENPAIFKMDADSLPIMQIAVRGPRDANELKQFAEDYVEDLLLQAKGVAQVSTSGGQTKIIRVEISKNRLDSLGLTLVDITSALAAQNIDLAGGKIREGDRDFLVRTAGEYDSIDEINNSVITDINGYSVLLSDIGRAYSGYEDEDSAVYINGQPGVYVSIQKQSGGNSVEVADAVYGKMEEIKTLLPSDITLEVISDDTQQIRSTIGTLVTSAWQGLILAVLVLFLFLKSIKSTVIIGISIPLSIIITLLLMNIAGLTLNMMTMTGLILGVGMIVDASVVILENIYTYRSRGTKARVAAVLGSQEMYSSVLSGNLTTLSVFLPFILMKDDLGMMGILFQDVIFTVVISLLSSLFVALFLVPVLAGHFLPISADTSKSVRNPLIRKFYGLLDFVLGSVEGLYRRVLRQALNHRLLTVITVIGILMISLSFIPVLNITMVPDVTEDSVTLNVEMPVGTNFNETQEVLSRWAAIVQNEIQGYDNVIISVGTGAMIESENTAYTGSLSIRLPKSSEQLQDSEEIKGILRKHFNEFEGASYSFEAGMSRQISGDDIDIAVRSSDLTAASSYANGILDIMRQNKNIEDPSMDLSEGLPQVKVEIDRDRAADFGISVISVANEISASISGSTATVFREDGQEFDVIVMYRPEDRDQLVDLDNIYVRGSKERIPVANFARIVKDFGPVSIKRENQIRTIHLTAQIAGNLRADEVERQIQSVMDDSLLLPDNVTVHFEGSWQDVREQLQVYLLIIILSVLLVFGVMAGTYESFKAPLINLLTIPFMIIGVIAIYVVSGQSLSMVSAIGLIMLVGIVVNNGIILVDYINLLINRGFSIMDACLEAGTSRLRPVLMTTLTTILGMIPMSLSSEGTSAMVQPIGLCVIGGLSSSTFITLLFIPVVYSLLIKEKRKDQVEAVKLDCLPLGENEC